MHQYRFSKGNDFCLSHHLQCFGFRKYQQALQDNKNCDGPGHWARLSPDWWLAGTVKRSESYCTNSQSGSPFAIWICFWRRRRPAYMQQYWCLITYLFQSLQNKRFRQSFHFHSFPMISKWASCSMFTEPWNRAKLLSWKVLQER